VKIGHFVTPDGRHGFILDRSGAKAKLQVDGKPEIVELTEEEVRERERLQGHRYVDPSNKARVFISTGGSLTYFVGGDELAASSDKEASPLGTATVAGAPKKPESPWRAQSTALATQSVVKRFPEFKPEDSGRLSQVAAAYAKADAPMFVHYVERDANGWLPKLNVAPQNINGPGFGRQRWRTDEAEAAKHKRLAAYGATITGYSDAQSVGNHIIAEATGKQPALANGTPGIVWDVDDNSITFVAFDGGRYVVDIASGLDKGSPLEAGTGASSGWPKDVQSPFLDYTEVGRLGKLDAAPKAVAEELEKIDEAWNKCAQGVWKPANAKIEINKLTAEDSKGFSVKTQSQCRKEMDRFETALVDYIDKRKAERAALMDKSRSRAQGLGLGK